MKKILICSLFLFSAFFFKCESADRWHIGEGEFTFDEYTPLESKPFLVRYYIPEEGRIKNMRVLIAVHGASRGGKTVLDSWKGFARRDGFVVIAPEFSEELYPSNDYQFGGVFPDSKAIEMSPAAVWTYNLIEALFDDFLRQTGSKATTYDLWGHSAGAQFTHRLLLAMPQARVDRAVVANAGSWTFPINGLIAASGRVYGWGYSVQNTPFGSRENLEKFFARNITICLGTADTLTTADDFPRGEPAMAQGGTRFERGHNFYTCARETAAEMGVLFNWKIVEVEGIGHTGKGMVFGKYTKEGDEDVYSINNWAPTAGYGLLFGSVDVKK